MAGTASKNGAASRESAEAAVTGAQDAPAQDAPATDAPKPADPPADAPASEQAPTDAPKPEPEPEPAPKPADPPERLSRRAIAQQAQASATKRAADLALAMGCEWHVEAGVGKSGVTVEVGQDGVVREYLTWVPQIGRVHKIPTFAALAVYDAGDLD